MLNTVKSFADLDLRGSLVFGKNLSEFPANPKDGLAVLKDGALWVYSTIAGVATWYPLTNRKNSFIHTQAVSSFQWTVNHNLGTNDIVYSIYDRAGSLLVANRTVIDTNSFFLNFTSAVTGRVVIFADSERYAASLQATTMYAGSLSVSDGTVTADQDGLKVNGLQVAVLDPTAGTLLTSQIPTIEWSKLSNTPSTISGYGITNAYTKIETDALLDTKATSSGSSGQNFATNQLTVSGAILPTGPNQDIGSDTARFRAIYVDEAYLSASTLYVDGTPVLKSINETIHLSADPNQGMMIRTTGTGHLTLDSQSATIVQTSGKNADVVIQSTGIGSLTRLTSATEIRLTAPITTVVGAASVSGDLTITGNLVVSGATTTVNSTNVTTKDNVIVLNYGEIGSGVTNRYSGFQIDRGDLTDVRFVFDENDDMWKIGQVGAELALATVSDVATKVTNGTVYTKAESDSLYLSSGMTIDGGVL